jgi:hypothetical protein
MHASLRFATVIFSIVAGWACWTGTSMAAEHTVTERNGVVVGRLEPTGDEYNLGKIVGDQVEMFDMFGGGKRPLSEVRAKFTGIETKNQTDYRALRGLVIGAFKRSSKWEGIWKLESAKIGAKVQKERPDSVNYLHLRGDQKFQIIKKGKKPTGSWQLTPDGQLQLTFDDRVDAQLSGFKLLSDDSFQVTATQEGQSALLTYRRTNLTQPPKAPDER